MDSFYGDPNTENTSGQGDAAVIPEEIQKWNWGAFFFSWLWGIFNHVWLAFLTFIPVVGFVMPFVLGAKGSEWAWRNKEWESVEQFQETQKKWAKWGIILFCIFFVISIIMVIVVVIMISVGAFEMFNSVNEIQTQPDVYDLDNFNNDFRNNNFDQSY